MLEATRKQGGQVAARKPRTPERKYYTGSAEETIVKSDARGANPVLRAHFFSAEKKR